MAFFPSTSIRIRNLEMTIQYAIFRTKLRMLINLLMHVMGASYYFFFSRLFLLAFEGLCASPSTERPDSGVALSLTTTISRPSTVSTLTSPRDPGGST